MGVQIEKSRTELKPAMSKADMDTMSKANDLITARSKGIASKGGLEKIRPVNNKVLIGFSYVKSIIAMPSASEAMRMDVDRRWLVRVSDQVARERPDMLAGSDIEVDIKRWVVECNGLPCYVEDTATHTNKYFVVSPECIEYLVA